jgi:hypothetical protein
MVLLETKTGSVKDGITELYKNKNKQKHTQINKIKKNVSRTCSFKFWRENKILKIKKRKII